MCWFQTINLLLVNNNRATFALKVARLSCYMQLFFMCSLLRIVGKCPCVSDLLRICHKCSCI